MMNIEDFKKIYNLCINTEGMGLNTTDDSAMKALGAEGIHKVALVAFESNVGLSSKVCKFFGKRLDLL